ncbi:MAG: hypothetical protein AAFW46_02925 [Pseudomonadota bacterium]
MRRCAAAIAVTGWLAGPGCGSAAAMTATIRSDAAGAPVLLLEGRIERGDADRVDARLAQGGFLEVWFDSPGGAVEDGYRIGHALRSRRLAARVPRGAACASACVDAFLGGVIRFVDDGAAVIVHPASISKSGRGLMERLVREGETERAIQLFEQNATVEAATWARYLTLMGVSLDLVRFAAKVPHACGILLRREELVYFNIVNTAGAPPESYRPGAPQKRCA